MQLDKIGHKLYYDYQINAFLFCEDIYDYSTINKGMVRFTRIFEKFGKLL